MEQSKEKGILSELDATDIEKAFSDKRKYYNVDIRCNQNDLQKLKTQYAGNSIIEQVIAGIERAMQMEKDAAK